MLDGRIDTKGTIKDLEAQGVLDMIVEDSTLEQPEPEGVKTPSDDADTVLDAEEEEGKDVHARTDTESTAVEGGGAAAKKKARKLVKDEERAKGNVKWKIYRTYLEAVGWFTWFWLGIFICGYQVRSSCDLF